MYTLSLLILFPIAMNPRDGSSMSGPAEAKTTAEILKAAERDDVRGGLRSKPNVSTAEYRSGNTKVFVAWYNPYSGEAACHVYIYVYDVKKSVWVRKLARIFRETQDVSVEFGKGITIRDVMGKEIHRQSTE